MDRFIKIIKTIVNKDNKVNKFITIFAGLGAIYRDNYSGINPDRTTTHLPTLLTGTIN